MSNDKKSIPSWLLALGNEPPPQALHVNGCRYQLEGTFKHDFFAFTGLYTGSSGKVVLKLGRTTYLLGLPARWIGETLFKQEVRLFRAGQDLPGIPRLVGTWGNTGLVHEYIEGRPLRKGDRPDDEFFPRLSALLDALHARSIAYVDLEKPENILLGDDGHPYLFDFQISWHIPPNRLGDTWVARAILSVLQESDRYHLMKHWRKLRSDQFEALGLSAAARIPFWIRWHRAIFRPITLLRRQILVWMGVRDSIRVRSPG